MYATTLPAVQPAPVVTPELFRRTLGRFATGVAFVTATDGDAPLGLVANSIVSVSLDPPLLSFCPSRDSFTWSRMRRSGRFGVNVLAARHEPFARRATPSSADRFAGLDWRPSPNGVPILADALAFAECSIEAIHAAGDHWLVLGRVEEAHVADDGDPLLFWSSRFARMAR